MGLTLFCFKITMRKSLLSIFLVFSNPSFAYRYPVSSAENCMKLCQLVGGCETWTCSPRDKWCNLKNKDCSLRFARGLYSGPKNGGFGIGLISTNVDCYGGDIRGHCRLSAKTPNECQKICQLVNGCEMWEYKIHSNICYLKRSKNFRKIKDYTSNSIAGYRTGSLMYYTYLSSASDKDDIGCH